MGVARRVIEGGHGGGGLDADAIDDTQGTEGVLDGICPERVCGV